MTGFVKKAVLGAAMAASALTVAAPASAQYYDGYGYRHRGGGDAAAGAIIGGIVGLGLGAAIASSNNNHRYYDRGYYNNGYRNNGYYDDSYYARPRGYYYQDYRYNYQPRCYIQRQYDRWSGQVYDTRICR